MLCTDCPWLGIGRPALPLLRRAVMGEPVFDMILSSNMLNEDLSISGMLDARFPRSISEKFML